MDRDDPEQAADRHARAAVIGIFAVILAVAIIAAFITTLEGVDTRHAGNVTQPGTIGLAKPHPIVIRSTLSKWLQDAATKTGQPNLVLAMIAMLLAATIVFFLRGIVG